MRQKALILFLLLVCGGWHAYLAASPLWENSSLRPEIRSQFQPSLLSENETYFSAPPRIPEPGVFQSFLGWRSLTGSLAEVFTAARPHRAFFQYAYKDSSLDYSAEANFLTGYEHRLDDPGSYGFVYMGWRLKSQLNERFKVRANWWNGTFFFDLDAAEDSPLIDGFHRPMAQRTWLDNVSGSVSYNDRNFTAALGRGRFQIANSLSGSIIFSDRVNDYDFLALEQYFGPVRFSFLHGTLVADTLGIAYGQPRYPEKWVALHHVSYQALDWLELYAGENVIYGNRGVDLSYLLPAFYWRVTKHNEFDNDNLQIYAGMNFTPTEDLTLYINSALDELTVFKLFTNWWGNKFAVQAGAALDLPRLGSADKGTPRLGLEFTAVRPWMYTHYNNHTMYSHDTRTLGYVKGSNVLDLTAEVNWPLSSRLRWDCQASLTWQGSEGSDWRLNYMDYFGGNLMNAEVEWLAGTLDFRARVQNALRWSPLAHHSFLLGHTSDLAAPTRHRLFAGWQLAF